MMDHDKKALRQLSKNELIRIILRQEERITALEHHLLAYENAHTPPSKSRKPPTQRETTGNVGAKPGHPRWEREQPEPTRRVEYVEKTCPACHAELGEPAKSVSKIVEEIPEPQPVEVTEHVVHMYVCPRCGKRIVARHTVPAGLFGKNLQAHIALLKFDDRLPLEKVVNSLERHYGITLTDVSVMNITSRVAKRLHAPYKALIKRIRKADVVYSDETPFRVDGVQYWLWTFVTDSETLFIIRRSRGRKVIEEVLGKRFLGIIGCDGWQEYVRFSKKLQRCWAHLLREAKALAEKFGSFAGFHAALKRLFARIKEIRARPPPLEKRKKLRDALIAEMGQLLQQMMPYKAFRTLRVKIENGLQHWFTCVVNLNVEPTNNIAERALRELIVLRKIIGGLRAEQGAETMGIIASIIATTRQNGLPLFQTVRGYL